MGVFIKRIIYFIEILSFSLGIMVSLVSHSKYSSYFANCQSAKYGEHLTLFHGRITKLGNKWLRWALFEAVQPAIRVIQTFMSITVGSG